MLRGTEGIPDMDLRDSGDRYNGADGCGGDLHPVQSVKLIQLSDLYPSHLIGIMVVDDHTFLIDL